MSSEKVKREYFEYLVKLVDPNEKMLDFSKLYEHLHRRPFRYILAKDKARAIDGTYMRNRFIDDNPHCAEYETIMEALIQDATVFEVMISLAYRMEDLLRDEVLGDRMSQWFWEFIANLGLQGQHGDFYDEHEVDRALDIFMNRSFKPDGTGNIIRVPYTKLDLRKYEIWDQVSEFIKNRL